LVEIATHPYLSKDRFERKFDFSSELAHFSTNFVDSSANSIALANSTMHNFIAYTTV
jgi:hypothetical protein